MPPAALMSAAAWLTPFFICAPVAALGPVIGPATPIFTWAPAVPAKAKAKPSARPSVVIRFIAFPFSAVKRDGDLTSRRFAAPAHRAIGLVEPAIVLDHLRDAGHAEAEKACRHADRAVDHIIMQRQQRAAEQAEMDEAHGAAEDQHVDDHLPPWPPGAGDRAAGERGRAAAEDDGDQDKDADRAFLVHDIHQPAAFCRPPSR